MRTKLVEATNNNMNWGKFMIGQYEDHELAHKSAIDGRPLIASRGWDLHHFFVLDMQTGEGATFRLGGHAKYDLNKHRIWVCPLYQPFLEYLYQWYLDKKDPFELPDLVQLPNAEFDYAGYRRPGPEAEV